MGTARPTGLPTRRFSNAILWLAVFLGGFVFIEPAPYDLSLALIIPVWMLVGLAIPSAIAPLIVLLILFSAGGILAATQALHFAPQPMYWAVTTFLAVSACFYACLIAEDARRLDVIARAWVWAAVATSVLGICGYFGLTGGLFVKFGRATGGFEDPNVFGPFLVLPFLVLVHRALTGSVARVPLNSLLAMVIFSGIFLSFSRAAWGMTVVAVLLLGSLLYATNGSPIMRMRFFITGAAGVVVVTLLLAAALSIPAVWDIFADRAQVVQDYDSGRMGRFERHAAGFAMMLDHPLGIGAMEFGKMFGEDEHNIWLKSLTTYGWLGFAALLALVIWTLIAAFPLLFRTGGIQAIAQIAYTVFVCHIIMALVIDIDHWRHVFLLFGILWGGIAVDRRARQAGLAAHRFAHAGHSGAPAGMPA